MHFSEFWVQIRIRTDPHYVRCLGSVSRWSTIADPYLSCEFG